MPGRRDQRGTDETEVLEKTQRSAGGYASPVPENIHISKLKGGGEREHRRRALLDCSELVDDKKGAESIQRGRLHVAVSGEESGVRSVRQSDPAPLESLTLQR